MKATLTPSRGRILVSLLLWVYGISTASDILPILLTLPTFILAIFSLSKNNSEHFTLSDIFWICAILFFVVSPCQNIANQAFLHGAVKGTQYPVLNFVVAQGIVLLSLTCFAVSVGKRTMGSGYISGSNILSGSSALLILFVATLSFILYLKFSGGINNVLLPRLEKDRNQISFLSVLFLSFQTICTTSLAVGVAANSRIVSAKGFFLIASLSIASAFLLVSINPLNSARFFIVATWLPVILALTKNRLTYIHFYVFIVIGVIVVMPLMSVSTRGGVDALVNFSSTNYAANPLHLKDMDVFDTLVHATTLFEDGLLGMGQFTLAIILFFIPRTFWPEKPMVAGLRVGDDLYINHYAGTPNLSFFFGGDFYLDFWFPGVILGSIFLGLCVRFIAKSKVFSIFGTNLSVLLLIGSTPILIRGPMGAVVGYFTCLMLACAALNILFNFPKLAARRSI